MKPAPCTFHAATLCGIAMLVSALGFQPPVQAQAIPVPHHEEPYTRSTQLTGAVAPETGSDAASREVVRAAGAPWLQVHFGDYDLGSRSYLTITSRLDGGQQRLDAQSLPQWSRSSAIFNGDTVDVELHVADGEEGIFFNIEAFTVGEPVDLSTLSTPVASPEENVIGDLESLCGTDDRVPSTDARVGRLFLGGCTAWLVSNGALLTAGHCVDFDPDGSGPLKPDGVLDLGGVVEFNVPASKSNGTTVAAHPNNQYPIDAGSVVWRYDGQGEGLGKDWAVFRVHPNANTGLLPHQAQGAFFRMTRDAPANGAAIRITGYGVDNQPVRNFTEQTAAGPFQGETQSGADFYHSYRVDTRGANSGSPIIWGANDVAVGIHTNAGCGGSDASISGANHGTSFEHDPLENGLQDFLGPNTVYVDGLRFATIQEGTVFRPFHTLAAAVSASSPGARFGIVAGSYPEALTIRRAARLTAPVGAVTIGR